VPGIIRKNDKNVRNQPALVGAENFKIEDKNAIVKNNPVGNETSYVKTTSSSRNFIVNGKPVTLIGDADTNNVTRRTGSNTFIVGKS